MGLCASSPEDAVKDPTEVPAKAVVIKATSGSSSSKKAAAAVAAAPAAASGGSSGKPQSGKPKREDIITGDPLCNVTEAVYDRMGCYLHNQPNHPLAIVKAAIHEFLDKSYPGVFTKIDDLPPLVSTSANFDQLKVPADHPSRSPTSTYYCNGTKSLRWHMLAHVRQLLQGGNAGWVVTGDVYRHDKPEDASHTFVFHQLDGVKVFGEKEWKLSRLTAGQHARLEVKTLLEDLCKAVLGNLAECRWTDVPFSYMEPAFRMQVYVNKSWLSVGRCGVLNQTILDDNWHPPASRANGTAGTAAEFVACSFGLTLEHLAMILFGIPSVQLFWSDDPRFLSQFKAGDLTTRFKPYDDATTAMMESSTAVTAPSS